MVGAGCTLVIQAPQCRCLGGPADAARPAQLVQQQLVVRQQRPARKLCKRPQAERGGEACCGARSAATPGAQPATAQPLRAWEQARVLVERAAQATAAAAAAAVLALAAPPPAAAVLAAPRASLPRTAEVALRRSIPAFNPEVAEVQARLEAISGQLRIPQRKPWQSMADDAAAAAVLASDAPRMLAGVLPGEGEQQGRELLVGIQDTLARLERSIASKDPERTAIRVSNSLERVAALELLQAPGLPYQLPRSVAGSYPLLTGRAVVELTVEKAPGNKGAFVDPNTSDGPQSRATLQIVLDGYSAPVTAGQLATNVKQGVYNNTKLSANSVSVLAGRQPQSSGSAAAADAASDIDDPPGVNDGGGAGAGGNGQLGAGPSLSIPLEIMAQGEFEPGYRLPLDIRGGERPVLPLSIYGAVAMAQLPNESGYVSSQQFFVYKFDRRQAGLAGLSFDEGQFGVAGYLTKGAEALSRLEDGDRLVSARLISGADRLIPPP